MLIVMTPDATEVDIRRVVETIESLGFKAHPMPGANRTAIGLTGNQGAVDSAPFAELPGVADCVRVTKPYKLPSLWPKWDANGFAAARSNRELRLTPFRAWPKRA
jgi:3-deoxy-7-phosphoheptulonate synthase